MRAKRDCLLVGEMKILTADLKGQDGIKPGDVPYIVPQLEELKEFVERINNNNS